MIVNGNLVEKLRLKIAFLLSLRHLVRFLTLWGFLLGVIILILRVSLAVPRPILLWALLSLLPSAIWAVVLALRETPSRKVLCALLDEQNRCGGLLMAADEVNLGSWQNRIPPINTPVLKWHNSSSLGLFAAAVAFVIISFLVPQRYVNITTARHMNIGEDIEKLQQQITVLEEENIIAEETAQQLEQKLDQLREAASGRDPVKTWEALDHLQQSMKKQADEATTSALRQTENLARAETLGQGLVNDGAELDANLLSEAMSELTAMVQSLSSENDLLKNALSSDCLKACQQSNLSAEQLKELLQALKSSKADISNCLKRLCDAELIDVGTLKLCEKLGRCNSEGLIAFLNENASCMGMCDALSAHCQCPGKGGITRGRADAPMTWTDGSTEQDAAFKEQVLPPASLEALKESLMVGVSADAPLVEESSETSGAGVLESAAAGSGEAFTHTILPRHKGAVRRYFDRD
jgi:hypothetical protein